MTLDLRENLYSLQRLFYQMLGAWVIQRNYSIILGVLLLGRYFHCSVLNYLSTKVTRLANPVTP